MKAIHLLSILPGETLYKSNNSTLFAVCQSLSNKSVRFFDLRNSYASPDIGYETLYEVISLDRDINTNLEVYAIQGYHKKDLENVSFVNLESIKIPENLYPFFDPHEIYLDKIDNPHLRLIASVIIEDENAPFYSLVALVHPIFN